MSTSALLTMLELQDLMNKEVNPAWRGAGYPYLRAVVVEGSEALEHHGWKWWKKQVMDLPQLQMEVVDIWHFILSELILRSETLEDAADWIQVDINDDLVLVDNKTYQPQTMDTLSLLELIIALSALRRIEICVFDALLKSCQMTWQSLFTQYMGKNILNIFRQRNGYKAGTYLKEWHGEEDNVHLVRVLESFDVEAVGAFDTIMAELARIYAGAVATEVIPAGA